MMLFFLIINIKIYQINFVYVKYDGSHFKMYSVFRLSLHFSEII
jgi:hypothetical protein